MRMVTKMQDMQKRKIVYSLKKKDPSLIVPPPLLLLHHHSMLSLGEVGRPKKKRRGGNHLR